MAVMLAVHFIKPFTFHVTKVFTKSSTTFASNIRTASRQLRATRGQNYDGIPFCTASGFTARVIFRKQNSSLRLFKRNLTDKKSWKSRKATKSFEIDSKVSRDVLVYSYKDDVLFNLITTFGVIQFIFWANVSYTAFCYFKNMDPKLKEQLMRGDSFYVKVLQTVQKYDTFIGTVTLAVGSIILGWALLYPRRTVSKLTLLEGGDAVRMTVYSFLKFKTSFDLPLEKISCSQSMRTLYRYVPLKVYKRPMFYLLDKKSGTFWEPDLFERVIALKRF